MYKLATLLIAGSLICAVGPDRTLSGGKTGRAGKSHMAHLVLCEKDPVTWECVEDGAWGKMHYRLSWAQFKFVFNGHSLEPEACGISLCS